VASRRLLGGFRNRAAHGCSLVGLTLTTLNDAPDAGIQPAPDGLFRARVNAGEQQETGDCENPPGQNRQQRPDDRAHHAEHAQEGKYQTLPQGSPRRWTIQTFV